MKSELVIHERINQRKLLIQRLNSLKDKMQQAGLESDNARIEENKASIAFKSIRPNSAIEYIGMPVNEVKLNDTQQEKYALLEQAKQDHHDALQRQQSLHQEIITLENEIASTRSATSVEEVQAHQQVVDEASQAAEKTRALIATITEELKSITTAPVGRAGLEKDYQDALAGHAIGQVKEERVKELEAEIANSEAATQGHLEQSAPEAKRLRHQLQGLQNLLASQEEALAELEAISSEVLIQFLMTEATLVGSRYFDLANELQQAYLSLRAIDSLLVPLTGSKSSVRILTLNVDALKIPPFRVGPMRDLTNQAFLFSAENIGGSFAVRNAVESEQARIRELGVRL